MLFGRVLLLEVEGGNGGGKEPVLESSHCLIIITYISRNLKKMKGV